MEILLHQWSSGLQPPHYVFTIVKSSSLQKRVQALELVEGEILVRGEICHDRSKPALRHVWWIRTRSTAIVACFKDAQDYKIRELTLTMCQLVWPNRSTRDIEDRNEQRLPNGTVIPLVPHKFYMYKLHHVEKSRLERAKARTTRQSDATIGSMAITSDSPALPRCFDPKFCLVCLPQTHERESSLSPRISDDILWAPHEIEPDHTSQEEDTDTPTTFDTLLRARQQILEHPTYRRILNPNNNPFDAITTVKELSSMGTQFHGMHVAISKEMIQLFHVLFPVQTTRHSKRQRVSTNNTRTREMSPTPRTENSSVPQIRRLR